MTERLEEKSLIFVVSGPAGSGKTTLCDRMLKELSPQIRRVITATTRVPRRGEENGKDYYFLTEDEFKKKANDEQFYEHAYVHSNRYGILKEEIIKKLDENIDLLINIDVQGAVTLRKAAMNDAQLKGRMVTIFIMPPSVEELRNRLGQRGQDSNEIIEQRLEVAKNEIKEWNDYDYCILSKTKEKDFNSLMSIYNAEKLRIRK